MEVIKNFEELKGYLKNKKSFGIYGAGYGGWIFIKYFCEKEKIYPEVVIDKRFIKGKFLGIPAYNLTTLPKKFKNRNFPIIITIGKEKIKEQVFKDLNEKGFKKVFLLSNELLKRQLTLKSLNLKTSSVNLNFEKKIFYDTCILHIGWLKTGSTSIQITLLCNENSYYGYTHSFDHNWLISIDRDKLKKFEILPPVFYQNIDLNIYFEKLLRNFKEKESLILSAELFPLISFKNLYFLKSFIQFFYKNIFIYGYIREPFDFISSMYQEMLKYLFVNFNNLYKCYLGFRKHFEKFFKIFGKHRIILKKFNPKKFPNRCVVLDFCSFWKIPIKQIYRTNESLPMEVVKFIYILRKYKLDLNFSWYMHPFLTNLLKEILNHYSFTPFKISKEVIKPIVEANIEDVRWMEKVLGEPLIDEEALKEPEPDWVIKKEEDLLTLPDEVIEALRDYTNYKLSNTKPMPQQVAEMLYQILKENFPDLENSLKN